MRAVGRQVTRYDPAVTIGWRVRLAAKAVRDAVRPARPQTYWQAWLSAAAVPLVLLIVGVGLKLVFHTWPQFDLPSAIVTASCVVVVGSRQSFAVRRRRRALPSPTGT